MESETSSEASLEPPQTPAPPGATAPPEVTPPPTDAALPQAPATGATPGADVSPEALFASLMRLVQAENRGLFASLDGGRIVHRDAQRLCIAVPGSFHARRLRDREEQLATLCERLLGQRLAIEVADDEAPAGAQAGDREAGREEQRRRRQQALNHPAINIALEELGGEIVDIRPLGDSR